MEWHTFAEYKEKLQQEGLVTETSCAGMGQAAIRSVTYDSRKVEKGSLFVCKGAAFREEYLAQAAKKGAVAYVSEKKFDLCPALPHIIVKDIRRAQAVLGAYYYGNPQKALTLTGITGTKGKTTTAYYLKAILEEWEKRQETARGTEKRIAKSGRETCGLLSTIRTYDGKEDVPSVMTTPEALELHRHFRNAADAGIEHMVMEVSSQALKYHRVRGVSYDVGIFLNISEDHISPTEHADFEDYFSAKLSLFRQVKTACVNLDAAHAERILSTAGIAGRVITFGTKGNPEVCGSRVQKEKDGISFFVRTPDFEQKIFLGMHGIFNVENALAAIAAAYAYRIPGDVIAKALSNVKVNGRMEQYTSCDEKITAIVDFAHNRLSFEKLYDSVVQEFAGSTIYTVFGCPGGKAINRRRELGLIAGLFSAKIILTADDPGIEDAEKIAREIGAYIEIVDCPYTYMESRRQAIDTAVRRAAAQKNGRAVVLVLGKGHETHQKFGHRLYDYASDAVLVQEAIKEYDRGRQAASRRQKKFSSGL